MLKTYHEKIWAILGPVGSIILARAEALVGVITGAIGFMDWSPITSLVGTGTAFTKEQIMSLGAVMFIKGVVSEVTRRTNDPLLKVQTAAEKAPEVKAAKKKIKKVLAKTPEVK